MGKDTFRYIGLCMLIYLSIAAVQIFFLDPVIDLAVQGFFPHLYVHIALLLIFDPILTAYLLSKFKWNIIEDNGDDFM
ncbi:MAG: hypothetical protein IIZ28_07910 [Erysipelotrichaceae bacterium]|nr:hypothetical protein [Erysipelotrichaceae bacterium]